MFAILPSFQLDWRQNTLPFLVICVFNYETGHQSLLKSMLTHCDSLFFAFLFGTLSFLYKNWVLDARRSMYDRFP